MTPPPIFSSFRGVLSGPSGPCGAVSSKSWGGIIIHNMATGVDGASQVDKVILAITSRDAQTARPYWCLKILAKILKMY